MPRALSSICYIPRAFSEFASSTADLKKLKIRARPNKLWTFYGLNYGGDSDFGQLKLVTCSTRDTCALTRFRFSSIRLTVEFLTG